MGSLTGCVQGPGETLVIWRSLTPYEVELAQNGHTLSSEVNNYLLSCQH